MATFKAVGRNYMPNTRTAVLQYLSEHNVFVSRKNKITIVSEQFLF